MLDLVIEKRKAVNGGRGRVRLRTGERRGVEGSATTRDSFCAHSERIRKA